MVATEEHLLGTNKPSRTDFYLKILLWLILALALFVTIGPFVYASYVRETGTILESVELRDPRVVGPTQLCPGDIFTIRFYFEADGEGIIEEDATWFKTDPPMTLILSQPKRIIVPRHFERLTYRSWQIPRTWVDERTGKVIPFPPGSYKRMYAVSSPSRSLVTAILEFPLTVKEPKDCDEQQTTEHTDIP